MGLIDSIIANESGGDPNAVNSRSSATGAGQFINSTWLDTIKAARPDLAEGKSDQELLALRADPTLSREMTEAYAAKNGAYLAKNGHEVTPGTTYLAHFAGPQGAVGILSADPTASVASILGPRVMQANPFLQGMTAGDLRAWADRKMGGAKPAPASPVAAPSAPVAPPTAGLLRPPMGSLAPPVFAAPPQGQLQPQQAEAPSAPLEIPNMQAPPIYAVPRRSPDLSKLRAAFGRPFTFGRG